MAPDHTQSYCCKTPIPTRLFGSFKVVPLLLASCLLSIGAMPTVWATQAVTVEVVVEQALAHPERVALREATLEAARHEARAARSTGNNPQLTWQEERRGEGAPATTDYLWLTQGLGGLTTGPARRHEARATVAGAAAQADLDDRALVAQVQRAFYLTLWHRERQAQAQAWFARLSLATEATSVRHGVGDASRWELERLQVEVERARAAVSREEAGMVGSWADLAQLTGASPTGAPPLEGPLEPKDVGHRAQHGASGLRLTALHYLRLDIEGF